MPILNAANWTLRPNLPLSHWLFFVNTLQTFAYFLFYFDGSILMCIMQTSSPAMPVSAHFSIALVSVIGPWWFHWSLCRPQSFTVYHPLRFSPASYDHHLCIVVSVFSSRAADGNQNSHECDHFFKLKFHTLALARVRGVNVVLVPLWRVYSVNQSGWISSLPTWVICACGKWMNEWKAHRVKDPLRLSEDEARCRRLFYETKWERRVLGPAQLFGLRSPRHAACLSDYKPAQTQRTTQPSVTHWFPPPPPPLHKCCWAE